MAAAGSRSEPLAGTAVTRTPADLKLEPQSAAGPAGPGPGWAWARLGLDPAAPPEPESLKLAMAAYSAASTAAAVVADACRAGVQLGRRRAPAIPSRWRSRPERSHGG